MKKRFKERIKKWSKKDPKKIRKKVEAMFEMKPEYYIGIDMIDQEHKQLFDYANEAYELLLEDFSLFK